MEHKFSLEVKLPEKVDPYIGKSILALSTGLKALIEVCPKTFNVVTRSAATLFRPVQKFLNGVSNTIELRYMPFAEEVALRKTKSQMQLLNYVVQNFADKEQKGEEIPNKIEDTDNLFAIQNAASETTDEEFIKFWAELYTREACEPGTVSKKTVNLCKDLDKKIIDILEKEVFPFCDDVQGFFFRPLTSNIENLVMAEDYNFLSQKNITLSSTEPKEPVHLIFSSYHLFVQHGLQIQPTFPGHSLTKSALEIKRCLGINTQKIHLNGLISGLEEASKNWTLLNNSNYIAKLKPEKQILTKFILVDENQQICYPTNWKNKSVQIFLEQSASNVTIEKKSNDTK